MSVKTKIQWCDSTCNPTMGCEGCELWTPKVRKCYAGTLHIRFGGSTHGYSPNFETLTYWPGRMEEATRWRDLTGTVRKDKPWLNGLPRLIFVSDMSDALSADVPFDFLEREVISNVVSPLGERHRWLWLTKRPDRMAKFSAWLGERSVPWPDNLWAGTSITTQVTTSRVKHLLRVGDASTIRFLSVEPQHQRIELSAWLPRLNWVIQGGESGRQAVPFDLAWAHDLLQQCRAAGVAYFLKQLGTKPIHLGKSLSLSDNHAGDWNEWPTSLKVRQFPIRPATLPKIQSLIEKSKPPSPPKKKTAAELTAIALKAVATRRANQLKKKQSAAALKAWETRRARSRRSSE